MKQISAILRAATRKQGEPLNILTFPTHERYETGLAKTGHNFYAIRGQGIKNWETKYAPLPNNYTLLDGTKGDDQIPLDVDFDLVLSQNKFGQFEIAAKLSRILSLPLVSLEHTLPRDEWREPQLQQLKNMKGHVNLFISEYSRGRWGWGPTEALVIHHGVDTDTFAPNKALSPNKESRILSVVNDWINRDWCCGFNLWQEATKGLPTFPVGNTPGLSEAARNTFELIKFYRESRVFINTSLISPVPTAMLEAMSCGCAVVTTNNCMLPEIIQDGVNGFITNDPKEMNRRCRQLLEDEQLAEEMGAAARKTVVEKFGMAKFIKNWNRILENAANIVYQGPAQ